MERKNSAPNFVGPKESPSIINLRDCDGSPGNVSYLRKIAGNKCTFAEGSNTDALANLSVILYEDIPKNLRN